MGRKRKYFTNEEKRIARNKAYMRYYEKNKIRIRKEKLKTYYEKINIKSIHREIKKDTQRQI